MTKIARATGEPLGSHLRLLDLFSPSCPTAPESVVALDFLLFDKCQIEET